MNLENIIDVNELPLTLTVSEVAKVLRISRQNAYNLCHSEGFPCVTIGKRMIIPKPALVSWLQNPKNLM